MEKVNTAAASSKQTNLIPRVVCDENFLPCIHMVSMDNWVTVTRTGKHSSSIELSPMQNAISEAHKVAATALQILESGDLAAMKELGQAFLQKHRSLFPHTATATFPFAKESNDSNRLQAVHFPSMFQEHAVPTWVETLGDGNCQDNAACLAMGVPERLAFVLRVCK